MSSPMTRDMGPSGVVLVAALMFAIGLVAGWLLISDTNTVDSRTVPTLATVTLAGNGMVYCPTDGPPLVAPCLNPPPTVTTP